MTLSIAEKTYAESSAIQDVVADNDTDTIKLYVESSKLKNSEKLSFTLLNIAEELNFVGNDNVTGTRKTNPKTSIDVKVKPAVGTYSFELNKGNEETMKVTVEVIEATMPTSYTFRTYRDEDVNSEQDSNILANTKEVRESSSKEFTTDTTGDITFKGNVNTMAKSADGSEYYRVRIQVKDAKADDVIAISKTGRKYETKTINNNEGELYVYLDANESSVDLVLAHKNASKKQIEKETASCHTVKFESTSKIWLRDARPASGEQLNKASVTVTEVNKEDNRTLDIGVKFDTLEKLSLETDKLKGSTSDNGDYWVPVVVKLNEKNSGNASLEVHNSVYADGSDDVIINNSVALGDYDGILLWVRSNKTNDQKISFTLHYNKGSEPKEDLPVTVILHNASAPKITKVEAGDDANAKALPNLNVISTDTASSNRVRADKVTVDTYKYGMEEITRTNYAQEEETGRWYSLKLTFNVPVESMFFNNSGNTETSFEDGWKTFEGVEGNTLTIWLNRDSVDAKSANSVEQTICNKWAKTDGNAKDYAVGITIQEVEKSKTTLANELNPTGQEVSCKDVVKDKLENNQLTNLSGINVETIKEDSERTNTSGNYGTFNYTLGNLKDVTIENNQNDGITTSKIKLNSSTVSEVKVNNVPGKWILVAMNIRGDAKSIIDETKNQDAIIIDTTNRGELLKNLEDTASKAEIIPLWINLSDSDIVAATKYTKSDSNGSITPFKVAFGSTNPVEEHNYFYIQIEDECANKSELPESAKPDSVDLGSIKEDDQKLNEELQKLFPNDGTFYNGNPGKAFVKNMEQLKTADISKDVVGDTVYVTIKDNFKDYYNKQNQKGESDFNIAFDLDLSVLNLEKTADVYFYNDGTSKWIKTKFDKYPIIHFGITIQSADYTTLTTGETKTISKEYIFGSENSQNGNDCSKLNKGYIRYVFTFVQE